MTNNTRVYGFHAVNAVLQKQSQNIEAIYITEHRDDTRLRNLVSQLQALKISYQVVSKEVLYDLANTTNHQGVVALLAAIKATNGDLASMVENFPDPSLILVLDHIQDPHNLGACLRTAECIGVDLVILPQDRACRVNDTVRKVASGAVDFLNILSVPNLSRALQTMKQSGYWIYGADSEAAQDLDEVDFASRSVMIMGSEGKGMKKLIKQSCDQLLSIPMSGQVASLNVSVATGITLYQAKRKMTVTR